MARSSDGKMPLLGHIKEFRSRIIKSASAIALFSILGWALYDKTIIFLTKPFCDLAALATIEKTAKSCGALYINGLLGPFNLEVKVSLLTGLIFSAPIWIYQLWAFITPALHRRERRATIVVMFFSVPLFAVGSTLAYMLLPHAVKVLLGFTPNNLNNLVRFDDYLDFVLRLILLFGMAFTFPVFLVALNFLGVLSGKSILKPWRIVVFLIFTFTAAFTPTPDPITMTLLAIPMCLLYLLSGSIGLLVDRRRNK